MASKNKDYPTNTGLIATLASKGITAKANQSADPGHAAQRAADFRAGVRYTPITSGSVHAVYPTSAPSAGYTPTNTALQGRLQGMGVNVPQGGGSITPARGLPSGGQSFPGPARGPVQPQTQYSGPMSTYQAPTNYVPQSFNQPQPWNTYNPWQPPTYNSDPIGQWARPDVPQTKPSWMSYSQWSLYLMDRDNR